MCCFPLTSKLPSSMCGVFFSPVTSTFVSSIKIKHFVLLGMSEVHRYPPDSTARSPSAVFFLGHFGSSNVHWPCELAGAG